MSEEVNTDPATPATSQPATSDGTITVTTPQNYTVTVQQPAQQQQVKKPVKKVIDNSDPERFNGEGVVFNAKLIGVDDVPEARGDKMCQEKITRLKAIVKASGEHKLKIIVNVSLEGIKLIDLRTGTVIHRHPVHRISFISRDVTDRRAFGYIFGSEDRTHKFFGIKTEKAAEFLVLTLRDLFQVVYENKKKEMETAKQQKEVEEAKKEEEDKSVVKLDGDLTTESSTDDEPTYTEISNGLPEEDSPEHIYAVPQNNTPVQTSGDNILELQSELVNIEKGIQQMNTLESLFDASPPTTAPAAAQNDPWGAPPTSTAESKPDASVPSGSSSDDLKDINLFGSEAVQPKKKEDIMSLFGPGQGQQAGFGGGFGAPQQAAFGAPPQAAFGAPQAAFGAPQPGFGAAPQPGFGVQPGFGAPVQANPFGGPQPGVGLNPPPIPQRNTPSPQPNPFGGGAFPQPQGSFGGANMFGGPGAPPNQNVSLFDEPVLAPTVVTDPFAAPPQEKEEKKGDAFSDLVDIGAKDKTNKTPKDLFADLKATPKKSINEMITQQQMDGAKNPMAMQASDPFGTVDNTALPDAVNFSSSMFNNSDPFDTSFLQPNKPALFIPATLSVNPSIQKEESDDGKLGFSDEDFDLPSPEGPPPPLPTLPPPKPVQLQTNNVDCHIIPPAPPPRPTSAGSGTSTPPVPPRNNHVQNDSPSKSCASSSNTKPVPRPRPRQTVNNEQSKPFVPPRHDTFTFLVDAHQAHAAYSTHLIENKSVIHNSAVSNGQDLVHSFVIEDPFTDTDPFAEADPFESAGGFSSGFDTFGSKDPFMSYSSQNSDKSLNGEKDDPFAVFDNSFSDSFNSKGSSLKKKSRRKSSGSKAMPAADPADPFGALLAATPVQNGQEPLYATVNKQQPFG